VHRISSHMLRPWQSELIRWCVQKEPRFPVKRMLGPAQWRVSARGRHADASGGKKRAEPAATDTSHAAAHDAICPGMAAGMPWPPTADDGVGGAGDVMHVPVSSAYVLVYPAAAGGVAPIMYGSYVVHAALYGVPSQHGLRDYWRHAYLFRERALLSSFGSRGGGAAAAAACGGGAPSATPDAKQRLLDERIVFTGGLTDAKSADSVVSGASDTATPPSGSLSAASAAGGASDGAPTQPVCLRDDPDLPGSSAARGGVAAVVPVSTLCRGGGGSGGGHRRGRGAAEAARRARGTHSSCGSASEPGLGLEFIGGSNCSTGAPTAPPSPGESSFDVPLSRSTAISTAISSPASAASPDAVAGLGLAKSRQCRRRREALPAVQERQAMPSHFAASGAHVVHENALFLDGPPVDALPVEYTRTSAAGGRGDDLSWHHAGYGTAPFCNHHHALQWQGFHDQATARPAAKAHVLPLAGCQSACAASQQHAQAGASGERAPQYVDCAAWPPAAVPRRRGARCAELQMLLDAPSARPSRRQRPQGRHDRAVARHSAPRGAGVSPGRRGPQRQARQHSEHCRRELFAGEA
jgi:hypothetical protein